MDNPLRFTSKQEVREIQFLLKTCIKDYVEEVAEELSAQKKKVLIRQLSQLAKSILGKARKEIPLVPEVADVEEVNKELETEYKTVVQSALDYKTRIEELEASLEASILAQLQNQHEAAQAQLSGESDVPVLEDRMEKWPSKSEVARLSTLRTKLIQAVSGLDAQLPKLFDESEHLARYIKSTHAPSAIDMAVRQAQLDPVDSYLSGDSTIHSSSSTTTTTNTNRRYGKATKNLSQRLGRGRNIKPYTR